VDNTQMKRDLVLQVVK